MSTMGILPNQKPPSAMTLDAPHEHVEIMKERQQTTLLAEDKDKVQLTIIVNKDTCCPATTLTTEWTLTEIDVHQQRCKICCGTIEIMGMDPQVSLMTSTKTSKIGTRRKKPLLRRLHPQFLPFLKTLSIPKSNHVFLNLSTMPWRSKIHQIIVSTHRRSEILPWPMFVSQ